MGYRINRKPPDPDEFISKFPVRNGSTLRTDFECFYSEPEPGHNPHWHDHIGWPDPHHPGHACQMHTPRDEFRWVNGGIILQDGCVEPIDFLAEGYYPELYVAFDEPDDEHIQAYSWIDENLHNIIYLWAQVELPSFYDKPIKKRFTLFAYDMLQPDLPSNDGLSNLRGDPQTNLGTPVEVLRGMLIIHPGAPSVAIWDQNDPGDNSNIK